MNKIYLTRILYLNTIRKYSYKPPKQDPGIYHRKKGINLDAEELESMDIDDLETDFMNVGQSYKEYQRETEVKREKVKYHIVQQKYFKETYPNFLTWNDKEQIKYLFDTDPEEWTVDKLSEGFPALPEVIYKIVKSSWTKKNQNKIYNHDISVQTNWQLFKEGKVQGLPEDLVKHLQKFTNRSLKFSRFEAPPKEKNVTVNPARKNKSFSEIINSYEKLKNKNLEQEKNVEEQKQVVNNTCITDRTKFKGELVTLSQLATRIERKIDKGKPISEDEQILMDNVMKTKNPVVSPALTDLSAIVEDKYSENSSSIVRYEQQRGKDNSHLLYPDKIDIPQNIYKKGCTYRLNDCFYDYDGKFLYRVPGMGYE